MQIQLKQKYDEGAINATVLKEYQILFTVDQFSSTHKAFTPSSLRNLIHKAEPRKSWKGEIPGNGLIECGAIIRLGRKVLIDGEKFIEWVRQQNNRGKQ